jgi:spore coat protein CotH
MHLTRFALSRHSPILLIAIVSVASMGGRTLSAQNYHPDYNPLYDATRVATIRITIDPTLLDSILAPGNEESDIEHPATFEYDDGVSVEVVENVGFRLRGNTSRFSAKKSYKVSFNSFESGGKFLGVEKLNLNGEHNDPSIIRSHLAWELFASHGVAASRAAPVRLFINGTYYGLYANIEHIDEQFLQSRFGGDSGTLYKNLWPADLAYLGPTGEAYRPTDSSRRPYDLKLRDSDDEGYDDLAHFIDVLNNTSDALFAEEIERVFDVNGFLRSLAVDVLTGSWDNYWFLKNNYYLYNNPHSGLFEYIPYDFDNSFGIFWDGIENGADWGTRDLYNWGSQNELRPLTDRIMSRPAYRNCCRTASLPQRSRLELTSSTRWLQRRLKPTPIARSTTVFPCRISTILSNRHSVTTSPTDSSPLSTQDIRAPSLNST